MVEIFKILGCIGLFFWYVYRLDKIKKPYAYSKRPFRDLTLWLATPFLEILSLCFIFMFLASSVRDFLHG